MDVSEETTALISTSDVSGTSVYNAQGETIGEIRDIMLDKVSGKVAYAVMSFGGFLGIGEQYHPIPWSLLRYDTSLGGYVVNLDKQQLEGAPAYDIDADPDWGNRSYQEKISGYYKKPPFGASRNDDEQGRHTVPPTPGEEILRAAGNVELSRGYGGRSCAPTAKHPTNRCLRIRFQRPRVRLSRLSRRRANPSMFRRRGAM